VLVASGLAFFMLPVAAAGLKLRGGPAPGPAPGPTPSGAPAPAQGPAPAALWDTPAAAPIRPGIVVQITFSREELQAYFSRTTDLKYDNSMDEMLGKTYVVKEMKYGGVGLPSPNGSQDQTWYFPLASLTPWLDTPAAKQAPVSSRAFRVVGLPTSAKMEIIPPGPHDAPWEYKIKGGNLIRPIGPPLNEVVDLAKKANLPPWKKVQQIASVECLEKLHKDPSHLCKSEAYTNYNPVTATPATEKPLTQAESKALKDKLKHLQTTIDNLSPKQSRKVKVAFKVPRLKMANSTMKSAHTHSNRHVAEDFEGHKMKVGANASDGQLPTAQGHAEREIHQEEQKQ